MFAEFLNITLGAQSRFERAAWQEVQDAMRQRLQVYENKVELVCEAVKVIAYRELDHSDVWHRAKKRLRPTGCQPRKCADCPDFFQLYLWFAAGAAKNTRCSPLYSAGNVSSETSFNRQHSLSIHRNRGHYRQPQTSG